MGWAHDKNDFGALTELLSAKLLKSKQIKTFDQLFFKSNYSPNNS